MSANGKADLQFSSFKGGSFCRIWITGLVNSLDQKKQSLKIQQSTAALEKTNTLNPFTVVANIATAGDSSKLMRIVFYSW
jgi:hypothetical protein